jgi:hypothetical protein
MRFQRGPGVVSACVALLASCGGGGSGAPSRNADGEAGANVEGGNPRDGSAAEDAADGGNASDSSIRDSAGGGGDVGQADGSEASRPDSSATGWWRPTAGVLPWQWELDHEIVTTSPSDMGTGDTTYQNMPAANPLVYDIDGFDNTAADVAALHALGKKVICYIEVGAAESYRPDYGQFPAAALGSTESGYPDEKYLNIDDPQVATVILARISMCAQKGFDGIEPDIDDSYTDPTGFPLTESDNIAYLTKLATYAHSLGLAWGLKNGADGGDPATFVPAILAFADFAVVEEPFFLMTISTFEPALSAAGKAMFVAEYTNDTASSSIFCAQAIADQTNAALFDVALDGKVRDPCQ